MPKLSPEQRGVIRGGVIGTGFSAALATAGYLWLPGDMFGVQGLDGPADRVAFALKADIPILIWLAGCVRHVSRGRFKSPKDIAGSAFSDPSPAIAVSRAVLQNSLEQTVLAIGAHLALATVLRGRELVFIPILVLLYLMGRVWFAAGYKGGAPGRAPGMVMTSAPTFVALLAAGVLVLAGR